MLTDGQVEATLAKTKALLKQNSPEEALTLAKKALEELTPDDCEATSDPRWFHRGQLLLLVAKALKTQGNVSESLQVTVKAIEAAGNSAHSSLHGDHATLAPHNAEPFKALTSMLVERHHQWTEASVASDEGQVLADVFVDPSFDPGRCAEADNTSYFKTLEEGVAAVKEGGTVSLSAGSHRLPLTKTSMGVLLLNKSVTVVGSSSGPSILVFPHKMGASDVFQPSLVVTGRGKKILRQLTFQSAKGANEDEDGGVGRGGNVDDVTDRDVGKGRRFITVLSGQISVEHCLFKGEGTVMDQAIYVAPPRALSPKGPVWSAPDVTLSHCVFDNFEGGLAASVLAAGSATQVKASTCLFIASSVSALAEATVDISGCSFQLSSKTCSIRQNEHALFASKATLNVRQCHVSGEGLRHGRGFFGVALTSGSSGHICHNLISDCHTGISVVAPSPHEEIRIEKNALSHCRQSSVFGETASRAASLSTFAHLGVGISIHGGDERVNKRVMVIGNRIEHCDVATVVGGAATPTLKENLMSSMNGRACVLVTGNARPVLANNFFNGASLAECGFGVLVDKGSSGMIAKNVFRRFPLAALALAHDCNPLLAGNVFVECHELNANEREEVCHQVALMFGQLKRPFRVINGADDQDSKTA